MSPHILKPGSVTPAPTQGHSVIQPPREEYESADTSSQILRAAARRVAARWCNEVHDGAEPEEVVEVLALLATGVRERQANADADVDERARSALGGRLLELLRAELVWGGLEGGGAQADTRQILTAVERVREAIEPNGGGAPSVGTRASGPGGVELLVDVAHDLRSPLTSILFLADTLQRGQSGAVNDVQRRQLGIIYGAALGLSSMANDIIELVRGGDRLVEKSPVPFSVTAVLEAVCDIVRPIAEEKQLALRLLPPTTDERLGHPVALSRILLNLTANALKFTDQGYVEISARETETARVEFTVRDSGKGIDAAIVTTLQQPLPSAVGRRGQSFSQTGLGLTMCRKLAEALCSELHVETRPGRGTRFFFEVDLPHCPPLSSVQALRR